MIYFHLLSQRKQVSDIFEKNVGLQVASSLTTPRKALSPTSICLSLKLKLQKKLEAIDSVYLMFDGWTDRYNARPYMGFRMPNINDKREHRIATVCYNDMPSHSEALSDQLDEFVTAMSLFLRRNYSYI